MSTCYIFDPPITEQQLLSALPEGFKQDLTAEDATPDKYPIGNGRDGSWAWIFVYERDGQRYVQAETYGGNSGEVLHDIADSLGVNCYCEHDEEFHQLVDEDDGHGDFITLSFDDIEELASDIVEIDPTTDKVKVIKKDGQTVQ